MVTRDPPPGAVDVGAVPEPSPATVAAGEWRALAWTAAGAVAVVAWITLPVGVGILFGASLAFTLQPLYERLRARTNPVAAGLAMVLGSVVAITLAVGTLADVFVVHGAALARQLGAALDHERHTVGPFASRLLARLGTTPDEVAARMREATASGLSRAAELAGTVVGATSDATLGLLFAMLTMYFLLQHWPGVIVRAQIVAPLRPDYTRALLDELRRVGRTTLLGTVVTGVAQGVLAWAGYAIARVPEPLFFGAVTALASLIPAIGTMLVWLPVGVVLLASGHVAAGLFELAWALVVVVGFSDYVLRPHLLRGGAEIPTFVTFASLFGGVEVFGLKGLVVGPVLMSLAVAVLRLYAREAAARRRAVVVVPEHAGGSPPLV